LILLKPSLNRKSVIILGNFREKYTIITCIIGLENINLTGTYINKDYIGNFIKNKSLIKKLKTIIIKDNSIG